MLNAIGLALTVSAAISLKPALEEIETAYEKETKEELTLNFGASGALQQQIENGAPVDLFISAAAKPMDQLEAKSLLLPGTRRNLLKNSIVLVVPQGSKGVASFEDLKKPAVKKIAVGDPKTVPAGQYAEEIFRTLGLTKDLAPKLVQGNNVRQVLTYAETKNVDAAVVFASDAHDSTKVEVAAKADPAWHTPVVYPMAVIKASKQADAARRLSDYLGGAAAAAIFTKHGLVAGKDAT